MNLQSIALLIGSAVMLLGAFFLIEQRVELGVGLIIAAAAINLTAIVGIIRADREGAYGC